MHRLRVDVNRLWHMGWLNVDWLRLMVMVNRLWVSINGLWFMHRFRVDVHWLWFMHGFRVDV